MTTNKPPMPYFPPFLSLYATGTQVSGGFGNNEDDEGIQGYDDDKEMPTFPEAYNPEDQQASGESSTPVSSHAPSHLSAYKDCRSSSTTVSDLQYFFQLVL